MCYAIPGRVTELRKDIAIVDYFGEKRNVLRDFSKVKVGDYVYAQGGVLINVIPEKEALEILEAWKERFFELKEIDRKMAEEPEKGGMSGNMLEMMQKANLGKELSREELLALLGTEDREETRLIREMANNVRQKEHDNACCVHGILEFSNYCTTDCLYCGIRKPGRIKRYRMTPEEIIETARHAVEELGFKALVLQSGEDPWYDDDKLEYIVREIRKMNVLIFISIGMRLKETYKRLYDAGARAVLLRFETSSREIFAKLRPGTSLEERLDLIRYSKDLGYILATGFILGLPGQNDEDILNDIMLTKSLSPDMYSFGPFIPAKGTPLGSEKAPGVLRTLNAIAVSRLLDRKSKILVTTALETLGKEAKRLGLLSGGNSLMINITPEKYRDLYNIYDNKAGNERPVGESINETIELLYSIGRAPTDLGL
jgi:biotin synthase